MSKPKKLDPAVRAKKVGRRQRRKAEIAAGHEHQLPEQPRRTGLMDHGNSPRKQRRRREGEAMMQRERERQ